METLFVEAGRLLISNGLLGLAVIALIYVVFRQWARAEAIDARHKAEIEAKDKLIVELQEKRITEAKEGYTLAKTIHSTLDSIMIAVQRRNLK